MNFAAPITPGDTCRYLAERLAWARDEHRRQAEVHLAQADALDQAFRDAESDARRFDTYQPEVQPQGEPEPEPGQPT